MKTPIGFKEINNWRILGPNGFVEFGGVKCSEVDDYMKITFDNGAELHATSDHKLFNLENEYLHLSELVVGDECLTDDDSLVMIVENIEIISESVLVYTPTDVEDGNQYVTHGGLVSKNCAFVPPNIMEELWASVYPVVSSAKGTKVILVSTPNGATGLFYEIYDKAETRETNERNGVIVSTLKDGEEQWVPFKFLWDEVPGRDEDWKQTQIESFNGDMAKWNQEFGCEFLGSSHILITADTISEMDAVCTHLNRQNNIRKVDYHGATMHRMHEPEPGHCYAIGCDLADGIGGDSIVINVIDITNPRHIRQVAYLRENVMNILHVPYILAVTGLDYNIAPILVESNHEKTIIVILEQIYEYENVVSTTRDRLGIYSTANIKVEACLKMKSYLESPYVQVDVFDHMFLTELKSFEKRKSGNKYGYTYGPKNKADDTVLANVWTFYVFDMEVLDYYFDVEYEKHGYLDIPVKCKSFYSASEIQQTKDYFYDNIMDAHNMLMNGTVMSPFDDLSEERKDPFEFGVFTVGEW